MLFRMLFLRRRLWAEGVGMLAIWWCEIVVLCCMYAPVEFGVVLVLI